MSTHSFIISQTLRYPVEIADNTQFANVEIAGDTQICLVGSLSKDDVDDSQKVISKCNFAFLQSFLNYSKSLRLQNVF